MASGIFAAAAIGSDAGLVHFRHLQPPDMELSLLFGILTLGFLVGCELCLGAIFLFWYEDRKRRRHPQTGPLNLDISDYVAVYPLGDRMVSLSFAAFFGVLGVWLALRSARLTGIVICVVLGVGMTCCSFVYIWTRVHFTVNGIEARLPARGTFSEPYRRIKVIRPAGRIGLVVEFSDGRSLRLYPGLGNADVVLSFLRKNCPEKVWKGWA